MPSNILLERVRQLSAIDRNAFDIYSDLQRQVRDPDLVKLFGRLAREEARHMAVEKELVSLFNNPVSPHEQS